MASIPGAISMLVSALYLHEGFRAGIGSRLLSGELNALGGGVDTQKTLPFGTPEEVYDQTLACCKAFGKGGYMFSTSHNIQAMSPPENLAAMIRAVKTYNGESERQGLNGTKNAALSPSACRPGEIIDEAAFINALKASLDERCGYMV